METPRQGVSNFDEAITDHPLRETSPTGGGELYLWGYQSRPCGDTDGLRQLQLR